MEESTRPAKQRPAPVPGAGLSIIFLILAVVVSKLSRSIFSAERSHSPTLVLGSFGGRKKLGRMGIRSRGQKLNSSNDSFRETYNNAISRLDDLENEEQRLQQQLLRLLGSQNKPSPQARR